MKQSIGIAVTVFALTFGLCFAWGDSAEAVNVHVEGTVQAGLPLGVTQNTNGSVPNSITTTIKKLEVLVTHCSTETSGNATNEICLTDEPILSFQDGFLYAKDLSFSANASSIGPIKIAVNYVITTIVQGGYSYGTTTTVSTMGLAEMKHLQPIAEGDILNMDYRRIPGLGAGSPPISGGSTSTMSGSQPPSQNVMMRR